MQLLSSYIFPEQKPSLFDFAKCHDSVNDKAHEREEKICGQIRQIAANMQFANPKFVLPTRYERNPLCPSLAMAEYINDMNLNIYYSYLVLIEPEDIPISIALSHEEDPKQFSDAYITSAIDWIKDFLGMKELIANDLEKEVVRRFFRSCTNPEKHRASIEFLIAHELSHLHFKHQKIYKTCVEQSFAKRSITSASIGIFSSILSTSFNSSFAVSAGIGLLACTITNIVLERLESLKVSRMQEKEADLYAAKHVGNKGAIALHKTVMKGNLSYLKNKKHTLFQALWNKFTFDSEGSERFSIINTHPTDGQRLSYLSNIKT